MQKQLIFKPLVISEPQGPTKKISLFAKNRMGKTEVTRAAGKAFFLLNIRGAIINY